jgi:hypothetical protein
MECNVILNRAWTARLEIVARCLPSLWKSLSVELERITIGTCGKPLHMDKWFTSLPNIIKRGPTGANLSIMKVLHAVPDVPKKARTIDRVSLSNFSFTLHMDHLHVGARTASLSERFGLSGMSKHSLQFADDPPATKAFLLVCANVFF